MAPEALEANRTGHLTPEQRKVLRRGASKSGNVGVIVVLALLVGVLAPYVRWLGDNATPQEIAVLLGMILFGLFTIGWWISTLPMRFRLNRPRIEQVAGDVIWNGAHYIARANGWVLRPFSINPILPPGLYTFYKLAGTNWLLSADPTQTEFVVQTIPESGSTTETAFYPNAVQASIAAPSKSTSVEMAAVRQALARDPAVSIDMGALSRALAQANKFSADDLDANRNGRLSGRQTRSLIASSLVKFGGAIATIPVFVGMVFCAAASKQPSLSWWDVLCIGGILPVGFLIFLTTLMSRSVREWRDGFGGQVQSAMGVVTREMRSQGRSGTNLYYRIEDTRLEVNYPAYEALVEGIRYRVYYAPRSKKLASIEPLSLINPGF
jgi:hypothetical protein